MKNKAYFISILILGCLFSLTTAQGQDVCPGTYATLPYTQNFDSWITDCSALDAAGDIPDAHWANQMQSPLNGNQQGWRISSYSAWSTSAEIGFVPYPLGNTASARFKTAATTGTVPGYMDLYLNCATSPGTQQLTFYYMNSNASTTSNFDSLRIMLSIDGGSTYTQLGSTFTQTTSTWVLETLSFASTSATTIVRFVGTSYASTNGSSDIGLDNVSVATQATCSGAPAASTISPTNPSVTACNSSQTFTLGTNYAGTGGITYQWETNTGSGFANVTGATNPTYTGTFTAASTQVNCIISCTGSGLSTTSSTAIVTNSPQTYFTVGSGTPYIQGFENVWINKCNTDDAPDNYWVNTPVTGNDSWRRDDDGTSANWDFPTYFSFGQALGGTANYEGGGSNAGGASSQHAARIHSLGDGFGTAGPGTGMLDVYLDLSASGTKQISYDFINNGTTDGIQVLLSTDGGNNFTQQSSLITAATWTTATFTTATTSSTCVLRFLATSDDENDMALDNVSVTLLAVCSGTPAEGILNQASATLTACGGNGVTFSMSNLSGVTGLTYQWQQSANDVTFTSISNATNSTYSGPFLQGTSYLRCMVTCSASTNSASSDTATITSTAQNYHPVTTVNSYFEGFESFWITRCATGTITGGCGGNDGNPVADDAPDSNWINTPAFGNNSWRRDDDGSSAWCPYGTDVSPTSSDAIGAPTGSHCALFNQLQTNGTGTLDVYLDLSAPGTKQISFDYINPEQIFNTGLTVELSTSGPSGPFNTILFSQSIGSQVANWTTVTNTTTTTSNQCVLRFSATGNNGSSPIGLDNISVTVLTPCSGTPPVSTISPASANVSNCDGGTNSQLFTLPTVANTTGLTYQWQQSTNGFTYSPVSGATNATYTGTFFSGLTTFVNCDVTCTASGLSTTSDTATVQSTVQSYLTITAGIPYVQSFDNQWITKCGITGFTDDVPDIYWLNTPSSSDDSWRRDDDGITAGWDNENLGVYTPSGSDANGASSPHSARFHSREASSPDDLSNGTGTMDLYLDLSQVSAIQVSYDYINTAGDDGLTVLFSSTGPTGSFTQLDAITTNNGWQTRTFTTALTSNQCVLRFVATGDFSNTDIGLDNVVITPLVTCTGTPAEATVSPLSSSVTACSPNQTLTLSGNAGITGLNYQWQQSTDGVNYNAVSGATDATFTGAFSNAITYVNCIVSCPNGGVPAPSDTATVIATAASYFAVTSVTPYIQNFENTWVSKCAIDDAPDTFWSNTPPTGYNSWRQYGDPTTVNSAGWIGVNGGVSAGGYTASSNASGAPSGSQSARFHSYETSLSGTLDLYLNLSALGSKQISFDYISPESGGDNVQVLLSTDAGSTFTQLGSTLNESDTWETITLSTSTTSNQCVLRFLATGDDGNNDIGIDNVNVILLVPCSGTPTAGTISPTSATLSFCSGTPTQAFSLTGATIGDGISYQWQQSTNGTTYSNISGATGTSFTGTFSAATTYVNCVVTCANGGAPAITDTATITLATQAYAPLPYTQTFENTWASSCGATDNLPDQYWNNTPSTGDQSWRRFDDGGSANWDIPSGGVGAAGYTPSSNASGAPAGSNSARFHAYEAPLNSTGTLDLYLNLSAVGTKNITFDYISPESGGDNLEVLISTDGGANFTQLGSTLNQSTTWETIALSTSATGSQGVLRFVATSDFGNNDMGIDNVNIVSLAPCAGAPTPGTVSPLTASISACTGGTQLFTLSGATSGSGISYQWQQSTNGTTYTNISGATGTSFTGAFATSPTYVNCVVTCSNGGGASATSDTATATTVAQAYASLPYSQLFDSWTNTCGSTDNDAPDLDWVNSDPLASTIAQGDAAGWRRSDYTPWGTSGFSSEGFVPYPASNTFSARFHTAGSSGTTTGNLDLYLNCSTGGSETMTFYYLNKSGADFMNVYLSLDGGANFTQLGSTYTTTGTVWVPDTLLFSSSSPTTIVRFMGSSANSNNGASDLGLDNLNITAAAVCSGTPAPGTLVPNASQACSSSNIILSLSGTTQASGLTYQWQQSTDGTTFTAITGATNATYSFTGQTVSTWYNCIVTCSGNSATSNTQEVTETPCYCIPTFTFNSSLGCGDYTHSVVGGGINYTGTTCTPVNPINQVANAVVGIGVPFTVTVLNSADGINLGCSVWVDYNNNGVFDPSEIVTSQYNSGGSATYTFNLVVPGTVATGSYRMRVLTPEETSGTDPNSTVGEGPCGTYSYWGSYEDFTLNVQSTSLTISVSSLPAFSADACGTSSPQSFTLSGVGLSPSTGSISVTAPAGFLLSNNGGLSWNSSLSENYSGNTLSAASISVEFDPTVAGTTSGNITFSGGGVNTTPTVTISGTGNGLAVSSFTVNLGNATVGVPSPGVADTLRGYGLTAGVDTVKSSNPDFQVSRDSLTWGSSYTFNVSTSSLSATPVYIRVTPGASGPETSTISFGTQFGAACTPTVTTSATGAVACTTPATPANMLYSSYSATGVTVTVTPNGTPAGYLLVKSIAPFTGSTTNGVTYAVGANFGNGTVVANTASATIPVTGLTGNTTYYFTVIAYNGGPTGTCGGGPLYSGQLSTSTTTCIGTPATPTANAVTAGGFTINWIAPPSGGAFAVTYTVDVSTNNTFTLPVTGSPFTTSATSLAVAGLNSSVTYFYRVTAVTGNGNCTPVPSGFGTQATPACTNAMWLGTTSSDWSNFNNWSCGAVPTIASAVTIPTGVPNMPSINSGTFSVASFSLASNTTLTLASGVTLNVAGNISDSSTVSGAGTVMLNGTGTTQILTGNGSINNLTVSHAATITTGSTMNITGTLTLTSGVLTTNSGLQLASTASGTARIAAITGGSSISGNVKVQQYIPGGGTTINGGERGFRFLGHPFSSSIPLSQLKVNIDITGLGGTTNGFTGTNSNNPSAFWFNPSLGDTITVGNNTGWVAFTSTNGAGANAWNPEEGLRILVRGTPGQGLDGNPYTPQPVTLNMSGLVNQGTVTETLLLVDSVNGDNSTYNFLGNPYPSPTDIGTVIHNAGANIQGPIFWVWDLSQQSEGAYVQQAISNGAYYLPANASFIVSAAVNNSTLTFNETNKNATITNPTLFRVTNLTNGVTLHIYDSSMHSWDRTYVSFNSNAANNFEPANDGRKLSNADLDFYSLSSDGHLLGFDARPYTTGQVIPLGIATDVQQKYIIKAEDFTLPSGEEVYLHDKYLNQYQQLQDGSQYTFSITADPASQGNNRFELSMADATTGVNNVTGSNGLKVSMVPNPATEQVTISYEAPRIEKTSVRIMNMAGQQIVNMELGDEQQGSVVIPLHNVAAGMYMVELISGSQIVTQRLVKQ